MSTEMKKMISKVLVCCMLLSAVYPTVTAKAMESDEVSCSEGQTEQTEGYNVKFITNGFKVEYNGKEVADGETVVSTKQPAAWVETNGRFVDRDGNEVDVNDINNPDIGPVKWEDNAEEKHGEGDGYIKFKTDLGNPMFKFDGEYAHMGYYGDGVFDVKGIKGDITIELVQNPNDIVIDELPVYSDSEDESLDIFGISPDGMAKETAPEEEEGVYNVTFVTNGACVEIDGKEIKDGDTVDSFKAPAVWIESHGYFVDGKGNRIEPEDVGNPELEPVSWIEDDREIHGDGDGAVIFNLKEGNPTFEIDGDYDYMGYDGNGNFKILGISEDITVVLTDYYGMYGVYDDNADDGEAQAEVSPDKEQGKDRTKKLPLNILGDINGDDKASAKDSMLIQRFAVNLTELDDEQKNFADVDGNGKVTNSDALNILRYTVKADVKYSIGKSKADK